MKTSSAAKFLEHKYVIVALGLFIIGTAIYRSTRPCACNCSAKEGFMGEETIKSAKIFVRPHIRTIKGKYNELQEPMGLPRL